MRNQNDQDGYEIMAQKMIELAQKQKGFLGIDSVRGADGLGITTSYWNSLDSIKSWKANSEHQLAQKLGRSQWYKSYTVRVCRVENEISFPKI